MTGQQLKNSILQMAVQGKLVPQDPNDEPASVLLERIRKEKEQLIKEGKIKKEKNPSYIFRGADNLPYEKVGKNEPVCIADEVPFEIPGTWEWVRLSTICTKLVDGDHNPPKGVDMKTDYIMASSTNINNNTLVELEKVRYLSADIFQKENERTSAVEGDIFFTSVGSLGRSCVYSGGYNICFQRSVSVLSTMIYNYYLKYCLDSGYIQQKIVREATGTAQKGFYLNQLASLLIPVPPLEEQYRIVSKYEAIAPFITLYANTVDEVTSLNMEFPERIKKSILQEAVQGKLVPQDENDEPASVLLEHIRAEKQALIKTGKIKKDKNESVIFRRDNSHYEKRGSDEVCIDEELPFEIPDSWVWCRLSNLAYNIFAGGDKPKDFTNNITKENKYPVIANGITNDGILGYTACPTAKANTITVAGRGTIGFSLYRTYEYCPIVRLIVIEQCQNINPQYLQYVIEAFPEKSLGTSIPQLTVPMLKPKLIPVPPLSEQNRIVKQIDKLLSTAKFL